MNPEELRARLAKFAQDVARFCRPLLNSLDTRDAALQLKSAAASEAANHRAAGKGRSRKEFVAKLGTAQEEADEAVFWLEHLIESGSVPRDGAEPLLSEGRELAAILVSSYTTARDRLENLTKHPTPRR